MSRTTTPSSLTASSHGRASGHIPTTSGSAGLEFVDNLVGLRADSHAEGLDVGVADLTDISIDEANQAFDFTATLPRR